MMEEEKLTGHFTLPAQKGMDKEVKMLVEKWGVDIVRDSDGTVLSDDILNLELKVYSTLCLIRADQEWAISHPDQCQQKFLISYPITCVEKKELRISILNGFSSEQYRIDTVHTPEKYWDVLDRTTGKVLSKQDWEWISKDQVVKIKDPVLWHVYTVNFLVYQVWETTSMYNYITNNWSGEHQMGVDPRQPETGRHLLEYLDKWLAEHPQTDYVRFTSMFYQFPLIKNEKRENIFLDWSGYLDPMSALALDKFEKEYGYRLTSEDIIDQGYLNATYRVPQKPFLDWMKFTQDFVRSYTKKCVEKVHKSGKKAVLFFCDHWIGLEPYLDGFTDIGFDGIIGPCLSGVELRRISDVPGDMFTEIRLYPYFFEVNLQDEPVFKDKGNPVKECKKWWKNVRRAMLRKCVDRIGFGGYLDLAVKYPDFLDYVEELADEFRTILNRTGKTKPYTLKKKIAILDCWGKARSWMHNDNWPQGHIPEFLSGFHADIEFLSFDDIRERGIEKDLGVIINWGTAGSAWSGGSHWSDPKIVETLREWIYLGGGFIGVEDPTAYEHQGRFFQLADVLGVEKETGNKLAWSKNIRPEISTNHFILEDQKRAPCLGVKNSTVYFVNPEAELLAGTPDSIQLSTNKFGEGRAVYFADYLLTPENMRLLHRAILWISNQEDTLYKWFSSHIHTECAYYPEVEELVIMNNSEQRLETTLYITKEKTTQLTLNPMEMRWIEAEELEEIFKGK